MFRDRLAAGLANRGHRRLRSAIVYIGDHDACPLACEQARASLPDARAGAGDEANLALEPAHRHCRVLTKGVADSAQASPFGNSYTASDSFFISAL